MDNTAKACTDKPQRRYGKTEAFAACKTKGSISFDPVIMINLIFTGGTFMKKMVSAMLALMMLLSLAACTAEPAQTTPKTAPIPQKQAPAPQKQASPTKIYLRVPDMECDKFKYAKNLVDIFNEGSLSVIFYDSSTKKYSEYSQKMYCSDYVISELKKLLGEENCILK